MIGPVHSFDIWRPGDLLTGKLLQLSAYLAGHGNDLIHDAKRMHVAGLVESLADHAAKLERVYDACPLTRAGNPHAARIRKLGLHLAC